MSAKKPDTKPDESKDGQAPQGTPRAPTGTVSKIADRLKQGEQQTGPREDAPNPVTPTPFDISKLSPEQLQTLKAMLSVTPDRAMAKQKNPIVLLRRINGRIVVDFQNAYLALVYSPERRAEIEQHKIPVRFHGEKQHTDILYKDFMQAEQVRAEVVGTRREEIPVVEGQTVSRETGQLVEMVAKIANDFFTVKLPETGEQVELPARIVNA